MTERLFAITEQDLCDLVMGKVEEVGSRYAPHTNVEPISASFLASEVWEAIRKELDFWMVGWSDWEVKDDGDGEH